MRSRRAAVTTRTRPRPRAAVPASRSKAVPEGPVKGRLHMAAPLAMEWSAKATLVPSGRGTVRRMLSTWLSRAGSLTMKSPLAEVRTVWPARVPPLSWLVSLRSRAVLGERPLPMAVMLVQVMSCRPTWLLVSAAGGATGRGTAAATARTARILHRRMLIVLSLQGWLTGGGQWLDIAEGAAGPPRGSAHSVVPA